jgi:hypothetical protein
MRKNDWLVRADMRLRPVIERLAREHDRTGPAEIRHLIALALRHYGALPAVADHKDNKEFCGDGPDAR